MEGFDLASSTVALPSPGFQAQSRRVLIGGFVASIASVGLSIYLLGVFQDSIVAAFDINGKIKLAQREASTFVSQLEASPAIVNDGYVLQEADEFTVEAVTFDRIDDGTIDLLSVDTEGSEWFVLKHMTSRPKVISIETHGAGYLNPNIAEIEGWMRRNGYQPFFKDKSDTVYVQPDTISLTVADRFTLWLKDLALRFRRAKKRVLGRKLRPSAA